METGLRSHGVWQDRLASRVVDLGLADAQERVGSGESEEGRLVGLEI